MPLLIAPRRKQEKHVQGPRRCLLPRLSWWVRLPLLHLPYDFSGLKQGNVNFGARMVHSTRDLLRLERGIDELTERLRALEVHG